MTTFQPEQLAGQAPPADSVRPKDSSPQAPTSVSRLNETIRGFIQNWGSVWVEGEITSWNLRGGNVFGRLKDNVTDATIAFRIWSSTRERLPGDVGNAIRLGNTPVRPGDIVVADRDGSISIPAAELERVIAASRTRVANEEAAMARLRAGETSLCIYRLGAAGRTASGTTREDEA